ncbi:MAG: SGNH/GDSL hydrolase family protein [Alteromonadaceae bacterium]|nr:SGNH/GDSL hydrolase family protein [Alteromonadaceae bacterium]
MKNILVLLFTVVMSSSVFAEQPVLVVGASFANASTPFNDELNAPLGGVAVGMGSFLSLGNGLVRNQSLSGHVINEAQAGATTFDRMVCNPTCNPEVIWQGYDKQLTKALARVTLRDPQTGDITSINAKYVIITMPNDCLHSDAFGIPQNETSPCTTTEINTSTDNLIALGQRILDLSLTPIFNIPPTYEQMDLPLFQSLFGLSWAVDKDGYDELVNNRLTRIEAELPDAVLLKVWKQFVHLGDGIHPDQKSVTRAAKHIARFIKN